MSIRKSVSVGSPVTIATPFDVEIKLDDKGKTLIVVNKDSVIYKSFNMKDIMIAQEYLDKETESLIKAEEKNTDRHIIKKLGEEIEAGPNSIVYIELEIETNLTVKNAEIKVGPESAKSNPKSTEPAWRDFPELIGFEPKLEYDNDGSIKDSTLPRRQKYAYIPLAYFSPNINLKGKSANFTIGGQNINQTLVQIVKDNIILQLFNYDGYPITYGIPFFGGTYLYFPPDFKLKEDDKK